ncbi:MULTISPECIES: hypothetical protein [Bacillus]|uniref:hypothetical protein n=1 Tax=Bacillus TaxID=1386 RepID=UPI00037AF930|nr:MULTISPECIES: hypothetical protein [Bacillus]PGS02114.1 hypothetical protein COC54_20370 [Bacillus pseudomycoides]
MKKYLVVGLSVSSLLVGCGQDDASTKKDTPKSEQVAKKDAQADKKVDDAKQDELKDAKKSDDNASKDNEHTATPTKEVKPDHSDLGEKYADRGLLNIGAFKALHVGMTTEEVAKKLNRNAESAYKSRQYDRDGIRYVYHSTSGTTVDVFYVDGKLYSASHADTDKKGNVTRTTLEPTGEFATNAVKKDDKPAVDKPKVNSSASNETKSNDAKQNDVKPNTANVKKEAPAPKEPKYDDNGTVLIDGQPALTEQEKAKILREEARWNTPSSGIGDKWQDEMKEMESQK